MYISNILTLMVCYIALPVYSQAAKLDFQLGGAVSPDAYELNIEVYNEESNLSAFLVTGYSNFRWYQQSSPQGPWGFQLQWLFDGVNDHQLYGATYRWNGDWFSLISGVALGTQQQLTVESDSGYDFIAGYSLQLSIALGDSMSLNIQPEWIHNLKRGDVGLSTEVALVFALQQGWHVGARLEIDDVSIMPWIQVSYCF